MGVAGSSARGGLHTFAQELCKKKESCMDTTSK